MQWRKKLPAGAQHSLEGFSERHAPSAYVQSALQVSNPLCI